jgi:hypothetical protein
VATVNYLTVIKFYEMFQSVANRQSVVIKYCRKKINLKSYVSKDGNGAFVLPQVVAQIFIPS